MLAFRSALEVAPGTPAVSHGRRADGPSLPDGRSIAAPAVPASAMFSLAPLLTCDACQRPLQPSWTATDERIYAFLCGCWREPITAVVIERVVRDRVAAESPMLVADATLDRLSGVLVGLFAEIRVGSSLTGVEFVWRI